MNSYKPDGKALSKAIIAAITTENDTTAAVTRALLREIFPNALICDINPDSTVEQCRSAAESYMNKTLAACDKVYVSHVIHVVMNTIGMEYNLRGQRTVPAIKARAVSNLLHMSFHQSSDTPDLAEATDDELSEAFNREYEKNLTLRLRPVFP